MIKAKLCVMREEKSGKQQGISTKRPQLTRETQKNPYKKLFYKGFESSR